MVNFAHGSRQPHMHSGNVQPGGAARWEAPSQSMVHAVDASLKIRAGCESPRAQGRTDKSVRSRI